MSFDDFCWLDDKWWRFKAEFVQAQAEYNKLYRPRHGCEPKEMKRLMEANKRAAFMAAWANLGSYENVLKTRWESEYGRPHGNFPKPKR